MSEGNSAMNLVKAVPNTKGFAETLMNLGEQNALVDVYLRSYPLDSELPKDLREKTRCVRIIQVSEDCLTVGPKRPLITTIIPFEEIAAVVVSSESARSDEEEIDKMIEEQCPTWERDFAAQLESGQRTQMKTKHSGIVQELDASSFWDNVKNEQHMIVDVYAPWCQPCKEVSVILDEMASRYGSRVFFAKLNGDEHEPLTDELEITAYPTVLLFERGRIKKKIEGARSPARYTAEVEILLGLRKREKIRNKIANGKLNTLSSATLVEYVEDSMASVIMFYEKGDYECQLQSRAMRELAPKYRKKVLFARADVKAEKEIAGLFEVEGTPELCFVADGKAIGSFEGRLTKAELRDAVEDLLEEMG